MKKTLNFFTYYCNGLIELYSNYYVDNEITETEILNKFPAMWL